MFRRECFCCLTVFGPRCRLGTAGKSPCSNSVIYLEEDTWDFRMYEPENYLVQFSLYLQTKSLGHSDLKKHKFQS